MWERLKNIFARTSTPPNEHLNVDESIQSMVYKTPANRRRNLRVRYSHIGAVGDLPQVLYKGDELNIGNLSSGGLLVIDDHGRLGTKVGETIELELIWQDTTVRIRSRVVGALMERRHIQFLDFNAALHVRITQAVKYGFLGGKFRMVTVKGEKTPIAADELWVGPTGESLTFFSAANSNQPYVEAVFDGVTYSIQTRGWPMAKSDNSPASGEIVNRLLVLLANLPDPTARVKNLIESLVDQLRKGTTKKTGTNG